MRALVVHGGQKQVIIDYVELRTGAKFTPDLCACFAVVSDAGQVSAGVVISNFRGTDCEISVAHETPMAWRPHVCRAVFGYVFKQLGCVRCTSITVKSHKRVRKFLAHFGFVLEGKIRRGYDGKRDALVYGLLAEECRFLEGFTGGLDGEKVRPESANAA